MWKKSRRLLYNKQKIHKLLQNLNFVPVMGIFFNWTWHEWWKVTFCSYNLRVITEHNISFLDESRCTVQYAIFFLIKFTALWFKSVFHFLQTTEVNSVWLITESDRSAHLKIRNTCIYNYKNTVYGLCLLFNHNLWTKIWMYTGFQVLLICRHIWCRIFLF